MLHFFFSLLLLLLLLLFKKKKNEKLSSGVFNWKNDFPKDHDENYLKYTVQFRENKYEMNFWKSKISDRWWLEVPTASKPRNQKKFHIVPCSYNDYLLACKEEVPERWLKAYQKLS